MFHGSHQLARLRWSMEMQEALALAEVEARHADDPVRAGLVWQEMKRRHDFTMNPKGAWWSQAVTSAAFIYYLAMTPAAAVVNLSQTAVLGVPILAAYRNAGFAEASKQLGKALRDFTRGLTKHDYKGGEPRWGLMSADLTEDEKAAMQEAYRRGIVESTQTHDLAGVSETGIEYNDLRTKWMSRIGFFFHHAERLNREVTFLAAYRMAREKGEGFPIDAAARLVKKAHFDYQNTSRPRLMQGDAAKVLLVFRNYQLNMLWRLFRDSHQALRGAGPEERREAATQLAGITGMMMLNAGVRGTWGFAIVMTILGMLFGGDDDDFEDELTKGVVGALGTTLGGMVLNGVPGHLAGVDITQRVGMPELWFRAPDRQLEGEDEYLYWLSEMVGAGPGMVEQVWRGASMVRDGHVYRGIETMAPKFVRDLMRATRFMHEGANTLRGDPLVDASLADSFRQAIGFTPAKLAERYDANTRIKNAEQSIIDERSEISADVLARIDDFNARYPEKPIQPKHLKASFRSRQGYSDRSVGGVVLDPNLRPRLEAEAAPLIYGK
jgi:hypothetical protein